ncbi:aspartate kinase [uncultured Pseudoramibacter sp.]|jgi:aspartate kinase|uniref:Aspartokinase n=1 Tax=Candidatus Pseudoramibacter fermentans TaxID=2594427 RepID=A0A6L5GRN9_9FIRM|nr:aspartate kinase [uncultured Pseudoramibacter sp.]MQM72576.1 aspartate kinase [Candidatus Pseudoramibacter fermentans]RRF91852.1 MAG: aspartate kinase [Eubacteriaceae bacterium]
MENLIVQKYGGTSVGSVDRIKRVAKRIVDRADEGKKMVVVVSAMGKQTDHLVEMAKSINPNPPSRELDVLMATGEQESIALLAMAIQALGHSVISLTGAQCGIKTSEVHKKARIEGIDTSRLQREIETHQVVIVAGFQGIDDRDEVTTLGRGGSDTSAVALAAALKAESCEIYTDVDGVYDADPRIVPDAKKIDEISYQEVLEMASLGAGVLHTRSVELAEKYKLPLVVRSSFNDNPGTLIKEEVNRMEKVLIRGIALDEDIAKISILEVPDKPGIAFRLFSFLAAQNIHVDMIVQNVNRTAVNDISFTVNVDELQKAVEVSQKFAFDVGAQKVEFDQGVAKLSIVGTGVVANAEIASQFFEALYELGINILTISTSEIKISCLIDKERAKEAMVHIHKKFEM